MQNHSHRTYSFAGFTLDLERSCLMRDGREIKLRPKSFDSLDYLIRNRGRVVTKNELIQAIWPDSFVTDDSLVQCVRDIRRALDDGAQVCIKTVPRRGYIFEAEVVENGGETAGTVEFGGSSKFKAVVEGEILNLEPKTLQPVEPAPTREFWPSWIRKRLSWVIAATLAAMGGLSGWYFWPKATPPLCRAVPLTSYPGLERNPSLSPQGNQVAFEWNGDKQDNFDIYVKPIGSSTAPSRLTTNPAEDVCPCLVAGREHYSVSSLDRRRSERASADSGARRCRTQAGGYAHR